MRRVSSHNLTIRRASTGLLFIISAFLFLVFTGPYSLFEAPPQLTGDSRDTRTLAQVRASILDQRTEWQKHHQNYYQWITDHDISTMLSHFDNDLLTLKSQPPSAIPSPELRNDLTRQTNDFSAYNASLRDFTYYTNSYYKALGWYDDNLMSDTRDLGGAHSQSFEQSTWPVVEFKKNYEKYPGVSKERIDQLSAQLITDTAKLEQSVQAGATVGEITPLVNQVDTDAHALRKAGEDVEQMDKLHDLAPDLTYYKVLADYDQKLQVESVSTGPQGAWLGLDTVAYLFIVGSGLVAIAGLLYAGREKRSQRPFPLETTSDSSTGQNNKVALSQITMQNPELPDSAVDKEVVDAHS